MLEKIINDVSKFLSVSLLSASLAISGCATYLPMNQNTKRKGEIIPQSLQNKMQVLKYDSLERTLKDSCDDYSEFKNSLLSCGNVVAEFESIESKICSKKNTWVIMYPILGGEDLLLVGHIARNIFARQGINSAILIRKGLLLPEDGPYRPLKSDGSNIKSFEEYNYDATRDTLRILDYLKTAGMKEFGLLGFSLGGMQAAGTAPFVPESKINIFVMSGADVGEIVMNSQEYPVMQYKKHLIDKYGNAQEARIALSKIETDLLKTAKYIDTSVCRMVITTKDTVVPSRCQWLLHDLLGKPAALVVPSNHYTVALHYFELKRFIVKELNNAFEFNKTD